MDHRRRNRRRNHSRSGVPTHPLQHSKPWSLLSGLYSFMIMSSLLALIYLMLEYHCRTCTTKCDLSNITKNIDDISVICYLFLDYDVCNLFLDLECNIQGRDKVRYLLDNMVLYFRLTHCWALTPVLRSIDRSLQKNLSMMKYSYYDLEKKIFKFSQELPKIEGQIDILEAIANTVENKDLGWNPKIFTLPTVEISSNKRPDDNVCNFTARQIRHGLKPIANQE